MIAMRRFAFAIAALVFSFPAIALGQQSDPAGIAPAPHSSEPAAARNLEATKKQPVQPRRKRGGLNSLPGDNTTATPAEGQSDLIKVLQPSQRTR
jgi:hypothetical protein